MCEDCGCSATEGVRFLRPGSGVSVGAAEAPIAEPVLRSEHAGHAHPHDHGDGHGHVHPHEHGERAAATLVMQEAVLKGNDLLAERNRGYFEGRSIVAVNLLSSPGSGKTTLLEKMMPLLGSALPVTVIEGDQQSMRDADRIDALGVPVMQINTGSGCHLDAAMVREALRILDPPFASLLFIENVGNLVCPALFDLGEAIRMVVLSVTEGDDKPLKYPMMFRKADLCILNKIDLLPYVDFDVARCRQIATQLNPELQWFEVSARTGEGMAKLVSSLQQLCPPSRNG